MSTRQDPRIVGGIPVEVVRKDIKNLHVGVYPPDGRVRVAAPLRLEADALRIAIVTRLAWIRRRQAEFRAQERQSARELVTGESHYVNGRRFRLEVLEHDGPSSVQLVNNTTMQLRVRRGLDRAQRRAVLERWHRRRLRQRIPPLLDKWEPKVGVSVAEWRIKRMKTKWGSCNADARRIWLNLELAKKPPSCLEYILVHELVHLLERNHTDRFRLHMERLLPKWELHRDELNAMPLAHEDWSY